MNILELIIKELKLSQIDTVILCNRQHTLLGVGEKDKESLTQIEKDVGLSVTRISQRQTKLMRRIKQFFVNRTMLRKIPARSSTEQLDFHPESVFDLSLRAKHILRELGVKTIKDLLSLTEHEMLCMPNIGNKSVKEIQDALATVGLSLAGKEKLEFMPITEKPPAPKVIIEHRPPTEIEQITIHKLRKELLEVYQQRDNVISTMTKLTDSLNLAKSNGFLKLGAGL